MKLSRFDPSPEAAPFIERTLPTECGHPPYPFVCAICKLPGDGGRPGASTHEGECRRQLNKRNAAKWRAKRARVKA